MRQYLAEGAQGGFDFIVDRSKPFVAESRPSGKYTRIPGRFSVCDCINGNGRRYGKRVWEKNLQNGSPLQESIARNAAFGLLEHPKDGMISLLSPISHKVTKAELKECKDASGNTVWEVHGEIEIIETEEGRKLLALIEADYNPMVSSRGFGSLVKAADGVDEVQEDYVCESWDVVIKPSFVTAELAPTRTAPFAKSTDRGEASFAESQTPKVNETQQPPSAVVPPTATTPGAAQKQTVNETTMNINEIKSRITALRGVNPAGSPQRFAESMSEVERLHQEVAVYVSEDNKRSWDGQKLHKELDTIQEAWSRTAQAPAIQAKRLTENNTKLMRVIAATAKTGVLYKTKLGESVQQLKKTSKLVETLTVRGQGWRDLAESRKAKLQATQKHFDTSCEALDIMTERYHADTTDLARRVIVLEFGAKAQTPEIQKALKEATRMRHIASIRETLEGKPATTEGTPAPAAGTPAPAAAPATTPAATQESQNSPKPGAAAPAAAPVQEAKVTLTSSLRDPRDLNESVQMVQRLSSTTAK